MAEAWRVAVVFGNCGPYCTCGKRHQTRYTKIIQTEDEARQVAAQFEGAPGVRSAYVQMVKLNAR